MITVHSRSDATRRIYWHMSGTPVQEIIRPVAHLYLILTEELILGYPDGPDMDAALTKLMESRDAMLRHAAIVFRDH